MDIISVSFFKELETIKEKRQEKKVRHKLIDIIVIVICAGICGLDDWEDIAEFGEIHIEWFKKFLELPHGIPSHDTFERVFRWIDPNEFKNCFIRWIDSICKIANGEIVAIDGKTVKGSKDGNKAAIHMVNVWASENQLVLGQLKVDDKSNEITAIPELIKILKISGAIVTIDAMGCQKEIAKEIIKKDADYVLALKGNQKKFFEDVVLFLDEAIKNEFRDGTNIITHDFHETKEKGHGRIETRKYWVTDYIEWIENKKDWAKLTTIGVVESTRQIKDKISVERRYYIGSIPQDAQLFAKAVRSHWGVENKVHWVLDMVFNEDKSKIRQDHAPANMAIARQIGLNLLRREKTNKRSLRGKTVRCLQDVNYLEKVLFGEKFQEQ